MPYCVSVCYGVDYGRYVTMMSSQTDAQLTLCLEAEAHPGVLSLSLQTMSPETLPAMLLELIRGHSVEQAPEPQP